jgi:DNA-binding NarL/FixJ family response regulator
MDAGQALVVVASAVAPVRRGWRQAIEGRYAVHEVADGTALERGMVARRPAMVLLDIGLPELGGVGGVPRVQRLHSETRIILLTAAPDEQEGIAALKAGARGYCDRDIEAPLLLKAVAVVLEGEVWVGRKLIPHLLDELASAREQERVASRAPDSRLERVTPRERQIVDLLSAGASNKEIAKRLNVTERTVKAHLTAIFRKLGISGRLQLALFALEHSRRVRQPNGDWTKVQLTSGTRRGE